MRTPLELATFIHENMLYDHPDPKADDACERCGYWAREIVRFLSRPGDWLNVEGADGRKNPPCGGPNQPAVMEGEKYDKQRDSDGS